MITNKNQVSKEQIELHFHSLSEYELCELFIKYPNQGALRRACLHLLGDKFQKINYYLTANYCIKECGNTTPSESGICLNCGSSLKHL